MEGITPNAMASASQTIFDECQRVPVGHRGTTQLQNRSLTDSCFVELVLPLPRHFRFVGTEG